MSERRGRRGSASELARSHAKKNEHRLEMLSSCPPGPLLSSSPWRYRERRLARNLWHQKRDRQESAERARTRSRREGKKNSKAFGVGWKKKEPRRPWSAILSFLSIPFFSQSTLPHGHALVLVLGRERAHGEVEAAEAVPGAAMGREGLVVVASRGAGKREHRIRGKNLTFFFLVPRRARRSDSCHSLAVAPPHPLPRASGRGLSPRTLRERPPRAWLERASLRIVLVKQRG